VDAAGKVPFFSGLPALDMLGLTDPHIGHGRAEDRAYFHVGHDKSDLPYILSRKPALIAIWLRGGWTQHARGQDPLEQAGYSLDFVLNTTQDSKGRDLVDVRHAAPAEIRRLVAAGYTVRVYVPYGTQWYGYLMRRLAERPANVAFFARALRSKK